MAKKTSKKPYRFRQARKDAKSASKNTFKGNKASGTKAKVKDITTKQTLEDREALKELSDAKKRQASGKPDYIVDDKGQKVYVKATETSEERIARDRREAKAAVDRQYADEDAKEAKEKPKKKTVKKAATKVDSPEKKPAVKKAGTSAGTISKPTLPPKDVIEADFKKATAKTKKPTRAEKSAMNKARWASMTKEERKNWSKANGGAPDTKPAATKADAPTSKRPTLADLEKNEAKGLDDAKKRVAAKNQALANSAKGKTQTPTATEAKKKAAANPEGRKKITVDGKTSTADKPTAGKQAIDKMKAEANAKATKKDKPKFRKTKVVAKGALLAGLVGEVGSILKGSTKKDFDEIMRLEAKLAEVTGKEGKGAFTRGRQGAQQQLSSILKNSAMGLSVGKTRRDRMDELNRMIAKASGKNKELRYGKDGSSLVPGTAAYKAGSKTMPAYGTTPTGGGSTSKTDSRYTVKRGDNLYNIAKTAGLTLAEIRAANPEIMKKKKYKQGAMIWAGTKVNIPKKK